MLVFTNAGMRAAEDMLDIEQSEILFRMNTGKVGARLMTALIFGATRKYHRQKFPSLGDVDDFMDRLEDESEDYDEDAKNLSVALIAAFTNANPTEIEAAMFPADEVPTANGSEEKTGGSPGPKKAAKSTGGDS